MINGHIVIGNKGEDQQLKAVVDGKSYFFHSSHLNFNTLVDACTEGDTDKFLANVDSKEFLENWSCDHIKIVGNQLYYGDSLVEPTITDRIFSIIEKGLSWEHLAKFLSSVYATTSFRVRNELYKFLENGGMPITPDGCFLAYKGVVKSKTSFVDKCGYQVNVGDNVDKWTRKSHRNNVGDVVYMDRALVNDDAGNCCAAGLHAGSEQYADGYGEVGLIVKIDPADVVTVPTNEATKLRCCKYTVIAEYENKLDDAYDERFDEDEADEVCCDDDYDEYEEDCPMGYNQSDCCGGDQDDCVDLYDLDCMDYPY